MPAEITMFLFIGYIGCFVVLNSVAFLISLYFKKSVQKKSIYWGFIYAIILFIAALVLRVSHFNQLIIVKILLFVLFLSGSFFSVFNSLTLLNNITQRSR